MKMPFGGGLRSAQGTMYYMGSRFPRGTGNFRGRPHDSKAVGDCCSVQKTDKQIGSFGDDSCGSKETCSRWDQGRTDQGATRWLCSLSTRFYDRLLFISCKTDAAQ